MTAIPWEKTGESLCDDCWFTAALHASKNCMGGVTRACDMCGGVLTGGSNYNVPVPGAGGSVGKDNVLAGFEDDLSRTIVDLEVNADQWTLMHRYNKAAELIEQALQVCFYFHLYLNT